MRVLFIIWSDRYKTGITILDEQLRGLVSIINSFFCHRGDVNIDVNKILVPTAQMFIAYVKIYCLTVEKLLRESGYPDLEKYIKLHEKMVLRIVSQNRKYRRRLDADGFLNFIKDYWLATIRRNGMEFIDYLREYHKVK